MTISAGDLQQGLSAAEALIAAAQAKLGSLSLDETAAVDVLQFAALFDPALLPVAAAAPAIELLVNLIAADNRSAEPGALTREGDSRKGSDPWIANPGAGA